MPIDYRLIQARRNSLLGRPLGIPANWHPTPTPVVGAGGGTGATPGTATPNVGGETWAGSSNQDGEQFNAGGFQAGGSSGHGHGGGLTEGQPIEGYVGEGLPTDEFSEFTGRAPTSADYYKIRGSGLNWLNQRQLPPVYGGNMNALNGVSSGGIPNPSAPMAPAQTYNPDTGKWEENSAVPPPAGQPQIPQPFRYSPPPNPLAGLGGAGTGAASALPDLAALRNRALKLRPIA